MLESWDYSHLGRPETRMTFSGRFDAGDSAADILNAATSPDSVFALARRRIWRERFFSWPWRPWVRTEILIERAMVTGQGVIGDDGEVTFTIVEAPPK